MALWTAIRPFLLLLSPQDVTEEEMAFGLLGHAPNILLRNWLTFLLRDSIYRQEVRAFYNQRGLFNTVDIQRRFNARAVRETYQRFLYYQHQGQPDLFRRLYGYKDVFTRWTGDRWVVAQVFP